MSDPLSLFDEPVTLSATATVVPRDYQVRQRASVHKLFETVQSVLLSSCVGSGKTTTFSLIVSDRLHLGRTLVFAHRSELVDQANERLKMFGIPTEIDQAQERAQHGHYAKPCVVGTIQTLHARKEYYDPFDFSTVVIDEAHHAVANSYQEVIEHFKKNPNCKILGVTGTPDRKDELALGQVFDAVAEPVYGIQQAITDGWLVKPLQQFVEIEGLDISRVRTTAGDLNAGDMAEILEDKKLLGQLHSAIVDRVGDMRTLVFCASVKEANILNEIFNDASPGCSAAVDGKTPREIRRMIFSDFKRGSIQYLINVGIATEGTDMPHVQCVANARMTKSRALYEQIFGRAVRTEPGCVDGLETVEERIAAIAVSAKPSALVLDFVGNSGKHKLITVADILGGEMAPEFRTQVNARMRKAGKPSDVALEIEQLKIEIAKKEERKRRDRERRAQVSVKAHYKTRDVDPFDEYDRFGEQQERSNNPLAPTPAQCYFLKSHGHKNPERYTKGQASAIIGKIKANPVASVQLSDKQKNILTKFGYNPAAMSYQDGKRTIDAIASNGWKKPVENAVSFTDRLMNETAADYYEYGSGEAAF